jgi:hypothetical protein
MKRALILALGALWVTAAMASAQGTPPPVQQAKVKATAGANFVDANGDGICDNFQSGARGANGQGQGHAYGRGKGDGTHVGPKDGTGFGARAGAGTGTGICDGTGPKGRGRGGRR